MRRIGIVLPVSLYRDLELSGRGMGWVVVDVEWEVVRDEAEIVEE